MKSEEAEGVATAVAANEDSDGRKVTSEADSSKVEVNDGPSATYRDYSNELPESEGSKTTRIQKDTSHTFPMKLHTILSNPEFQDIIAWLPHGRAWRILQHKAFEERVIPLYFRHGRYSSFARQVNGWGFRR